jgi:palmitoyltransferase ZDHHC9/14/18
MPRLPKVSHCKVCNNCVRGFDHHCDILNNCIGIRNIKAYTLMTIFELIYAGGLIVLGAIYLIH